MGAFQSDKINETAIASSQGLAQVKLLGELLEMNHEKVNEVLTDEE